MNDVERVFHSPEPSNVRPIRYEYVEEIIEVNGKEVLCHFPVMKGALDLDKGSISIHQPKKLSNTEIDALVVKEVDSNVPE